MQGSCSSAPDSRSKRSCRPQPISRRSWDAAANQQALLSVCWTRGPCSYNTPNTSTVEKTHDHRWKDRQIDCKWPSRGQACYAFTLFFSSFVSFLYYITLCYSQGYDTHTQREIVKKKKERIRKRKARDLLFSAPLILLSSLFSLHSSFVLSSCYNALLHSGLRHTHKKR